MPAPTPDSRTRRACLGGIAAVTGLLAGCTDGRRERSVESPTTTESTRTTNPTTTGAVFPGYETTDLVVRGPDETPRGSITAAIADTPATRYTGLSDTESLPWNWGLLFVFAEASDRTFVMRKMDFGIDIVYADAGRTITAIHHAPAPGPTEDGSDQHYPGYGQYVVEVNRGWTTDHGAVVGDTLSFGLRRP